VQNYIDHQYRSLLDSRIRSGRASPFMAVHSDQALSEQTISNVPLYGCGALAWERNSEATTLLCDYKMLLAAWIINTCSSSRRNCIESKLQEIDTCRYRTTMSSYHDARLCRVSTCAERAEDCLPGPRQLLLKAQMIKITFQVQQLVTQEEEQEYTRC
jgi:hypothetical protein